MPLLEKVTKASQNPLLVCLDSTWLGGAEAASVIEEFAGLQSVALEVLGEELTMLRADLTSQSQAPCVARAPTSGLNKLCRPDAVLYQGMMPIIALSGHTEGHLATMQLEDALHQFPASFRMPVVATFDLNRLPTVPVIEPCQRIRL